jgi:hypothetical protein
VVTAGVLGSLGVAGVIAVSNGSTSTGSTSAQSSTPSGGSFSQWQAQQTAPGSSGDDRGEGGGFEADDGGGQLPQAAPGPVTGQAPPAMQPGVGGTSHGTTTGS